MCQYVQQNKLHEMAVVLNIFEIISKIKCKCLLKHKNLIET